jgi:hypothetical protein
MTALFMGAALLSMVVAALPQSSSDFWGLIALSMFLIGAVSLTI